jgi:hypothetical protein
MKKSIITLTLVLIYTISLLSQNIEPSALYYLDPQSSGALKQFSINDSVYMQKNIVLGWQWHNFPIVTKSLRMNMTENFEPSWSADNLEDNNTGKDINFIFQLVHNNPEIVPHLNSNSFTFKPTLNITSSFTPVSGDTEHNIWGFRNRISNPVVINNRLELKRDTTYSNPVLSNPWRGNCFYYNSTNADTLFNGTHYVVSVNLRRKYFTSNNESDATPVMSLVIPYYLTGSSDTGKIKFNSVPNRTIRTALTYTYYVDGTPYIINRGYCLGIDSAATDSLVITRNMLPTLADSIAGIGPDITISFTFIADKQILHGNNPIFKSSSGDTLRPDLIDSIGLNVYYHGNTSILLNYIRIGNPISDYMWKGKYDSLLQSNLQTKIIDINNKHYKLFRFYGHDEFADLYAKWDAMRYFNKLVGGLAVSEGSSCDKRYLYRTETENTWYGAINPGSCAAPFFTKNITEDGYRDANWNVYDSINYYRLNYQYGFIKNPYTLVVDSLNPPYETWSNMPDDPNRWYNVRGMPYDSIYNDRDTHRTRQGESYFELLTNPALFGEAFQWMIESDTHKFFVDKDINALLYSNKPWWMNCFIFGQIKTDVKIVEPDSSYWRDRYRFHPYFSDVCRPMTGEESRWSLWRVILFAGKGLCYDGHLQSALGFFEQNSAYAANGLTNGIGFSSSTLGTSPSDSLILYKDDLYTGLDFIPQVDTASGLTDIPVDSVYVYPDGGKSYFYIGRQHTLNRDSVVKFLGCDINRIYTGRKSNKLEMFKIHSFLSEHNVDSLLMRLRLVSALSKGIRCWHSWDQARYGNNPLRKYVNFDTSQIIFQTPNDTANNKTTLPSAYIRTRPIDRVKSDGTPDYEPWDSTMCDITLLRLDTDSSLVNGMFTQPVFIGLQNRWTSPLVRFRDPSDNLYTRFLSTAEFDDSCDYGTNTAQFRSLYNRRMGCREIVIPFNVCNTSNPDQHYLIKVTEVKADSVYDDNWPWWRKDRFRRYIDTIISGTSELAINFLPGEGKLLKIQTLKPESTNGFLAYNNQHKLISYSIYKSGQETDSIRFHLVYHKPLLNRYAVYYQRSKPVFKNSDYSAVDWETPINVSNSIDDGIGTTRTNFNCAYPSILIRKDDTTDKAYIVFSSRDTLHTVNICNQCPDTCHYFWHPICETILSLANDTAIVLSSQIIIRSVKGPFPANWTDANFGLPVNNAVADGNFTVWGDSACGIGVAFKAPNATTFNINNIQYFKYNYQATASHPSVNLYSEIESGANDCSIVWQEQVGTDNSKIYYTRYLWDGYQIQRFRPPFYTKYVYMGNIYLLSSLVKSCTYPTVYRTPKSIESWFYPNLQQEVVAWESHSTPTASNSDISLTVLKMYHDDSFYYTSGYLFPTYTIMGTPDYYYNQTTFRQPVLSQPASYANQSYGSYSNYRYLLNYVQIEYNGSKTIQHIEPLFGSIITTGNKIDNYIINRFPVADGLYPHLAISPKSNNSNIRKNLRIFEDSTISSGPRIMPNSKYFYSNPGTSCCSKTGFFGRSTGMGKFDISRIMTALPLTEAVNLSFNLPYEEVIDSVNGNDYIPIQADTLYSDWFHVDSVATLSYVMNFNDTISVTLRLQQESTGNFTYIPVPYIPNSEFMNFVYFLVNGDNDNYRMAMISRDTNSVYGETIIEDFLTADTLYSKGSVESHQMINLRQERTLKEDAYLEIRPNPANEFVNVITYTTSSQPVNYTIFNSQGMEVFRLKGRSNNQYRIDTQNLRTGVYIVKSEIDRVVKTQKLLIAK